MLPPPGRTDNPSPPPLVAVSGIGGSGTRLVAALLAEFGVFLGHDLNHPELDNLAYTLLFKRREALLLSDAEIDRDLQLFAAAMTRTRTLTLQEQAYLHALALHDRPRHAADWLQARANALIAAPQAPLPNSQPWGWKEPNAHILLPALIRNFPEMRYIHVVRNGLDMAFSENNYQLPYWADALLGYAGEPDAARALSYWCAVQQRARRCGETMGARFFWLDYDRFCLQPEHGLERLHRFLGLSGPTTDAMLAMIHPPASMGRFRQADCSMFSAQDIALVAELGFAVE